MDERTEELHRQQEILNILKHRRDLYEKQRAILGDRTPPDVTIGIAGTERDIRIVEAKMRALQIDPKVLEVAGVEGLFLDVSEQIRGLTDSVALLGADLSAQNTRIDAIETKVNTIEALQAESAIWRAAQDEARPERQAELDKRLDKQDTRLRHIFWQVCGALALIGVIVGILLYVFR